MKNQSKNGMSEVCQKETSTSEGWLPIPFKVWEAFIQRDITAVEMKVYGEILRHGGGMISNKIIAEWCGKIANSYTSTAVNKLHKLGFLDLIFDRSEDGNVINREVKIPGISYTFIEDPPSDKTEPPFRKTEITPFRKNEIGGSKSSTNTKSKNKVIEISKSTEVAEDGKLSFMPEKFEEKTEELPPVENYLPYMKPGWKSVKAKYSKTFQGRVEIIARKIKDNESLNAPDLVTAFKWMSLEKGYTITVWKKHEHKVRSVLDNNEDVGCYGILAAMRYYIENCLTVHNRFNKNDAFPSIDIFTGYLDYFIGETHGKGTREKDPSVF